MALDSVIRSKIMRQEMDAALVGPSFTSYEGRVKYNPENVEKEDFFSLCYGMLKIGDEVKLHTYKKDKFNVYYRFLIVDVDKEEKKVTSMLLNKFDFMNPEVNVEVEGVDMEALNKAVQVMVEAKTKDLVKIINELQAGFKKYTEETDDQLEEIENAIEELQEAPTAPIAAPDGSTVDTTEDESDEDENEDEEGEE
jgi:intracellular sulfur oxidation DsrE/DsrF family protein